MSKCCRKKKSRSFSKRRESRKNPPTRSKRNTPSKNHAPLSTEERATIANFVKNISECCLSSEPDLTEPIEPRYALFGDNRLKNIKHILDARAAQCKTAYLAKQNISALKDASGDDHLVAKQNPFASHADQDEESLVAKKLPIVPHVNQNEEPHVAQKTPPPTWDETPLVAKKKSRSLRPKVDDGPRPPGRPLWMPEGADLERMPVEVRQAVAEILRPAYEELVVQAGSGMEKSLGESLVHLLWLEILEQYDIKKDYCKFDLLLEIDGTRGFAIDRYLKLVNSKLRLSSMLTRLRQLRLKEQKSSPLPQAGTTKWSGSGVRAANDVNSSKNVQNSNFAHENRTSESPSQSQTWKNNDLAPKTESSVPLPSSTFPDQKSLNVQKQEFDDEIAPRSLEKEDSHMM
jgi:hypothetical protein